jgi:phosphatidylglycerol---prolipoprotein diacylglyceryl transferase
MTPLSWALLTLPSPSSPTVIKVGPLALSYHGLFIALGIVAGAWITQRQLVSRGYDGVLAFEALLIVVPAGVVGARLYHVVTEYDRYADRLTSALRVWDGGLAIYGAVAGGFVGLLVFCWFRGARLLDFADAAAPGLVLGQAIGRMGNYFNQELFGRPSGLPWAIDIAPHNRPVQYADATSFHPTFAYEALWDVLVCLALLWVARYFARDLKKGDIFLLYVALYSVGRFLVETLRVDRAFLIGETIPGNLVVSGVLAVGATLVLYLRHRSRHRPKPK